MGVGRQKKDESPLPSREGARGRGVSQLGRTLDSAEPVWVGVVLPWHSRADARRPLPLPPSRKARGDNKRAQRDGAVTDGHRFGGAA
ncbi:hypothetical protein QFZ27_002627 [Inquilinus ginsengisoli]